jgi:hypothetical protein
MGVDSAREADLSRLELMLSFGAFCWRANTLNDDPRMISCTRLLYFASNKVVVFFQRFWIPELVVIHLVMIPQ